MAKHTNKSIWLKSLVIIPVLSLLVGLFVFYRYSQSKKISEDFKQALIAYGKGELEKAKSICEKNIEPFLSQEQGCDLLVSVYAESKLYVELEPIAKACLALQEPPEIAFEGIGFSLVHQGRGEEALSLFEKLKHVHGSKDRYKVALANIYYEMNQAGLAQEVFLDLLKTSPIWSAWLTRALTMKQLKNNRFFLEQVQIQVRDKIHRFPKIEQKLNVQLDLLGISH